MMNRVKSLAILLAALSVLASCRSNETLESRSSNEFYSEKYRPLVHFSPKEKWMNDPNGMVYYNDEYHLFYQYYPDSTVWGPMHWGHAVSKDLVHWEHLPIALYPDSLGLIFSGSAVVDINNTSGLGTVEKPALVAIYTYHSMEKEKKGRTDYQTQGLAYSNDNGRTWKKYEQNPIIRNPGIKDFRDPKVIWHEPSGKWVMILAVQDHVEFYGSNDLKNWNKLSEWGKEYGAHGGVWECPDLFELNVDADSLKRWVMLVSINPGGPNGGSATQYFIGDFDGEKFVSTYDKTKQTWLDYGPDNYAGVTWSNAPGGRKIFLGWMNNWAYGQVVPTKTWRGAMTSPRDLSLARLGDNYFVKSKLSEEFRNYGRDPKTIPEIRVADTVDLTEQIGGTLTPSIIEGSIEAGKFMFEFSSARGEKIKVRFDGNNYLLERDRGGMEGLSDSFNRFSSSPRISQEKEIRFTMVIDVASFELFFDDGLSVMTGTFFFEEPLSRLRVASEQNTIRDFELRKLNSIWKN